jgi:hypothetical protein
MSTTVQVLAVVIGVMLTSVWIMEAFLYRPQAGEALVYFAAAQHVFLAGVLLVTRPKLWLNAVMESVLGIVLLAFALS